MRDCYLVSGAGDEEFNGFYECDTLRVGGQRSRGDSIPCYRKVGESSCTMNFNRRENAWHLCKNHSGSWYRASSQAIEPPASGWVTANSGKAPAPTMWYAHSVGLTPVQVSLRS